jgi:hypothetical protein
MSATDVSLRLSSTPHPGAASAFPRHASLLVVVILMSRVSLARRLSARAARLGARALLRTGWLRKEARVAVINLVDSSDVCMRTLLALERLADARGSTAAMGFSKMSLVQIDDFCDEAVERLPLRAFRHPAREPLRQAHAMVVVFDLADRSRLRDVKAAVLRASLLADRHRRHLPLLFLAANLDRPGAVGMAELRTLLGPSNPLPPPWEVVRVLLAGRRSPSSPWRQLPEELIRSIVRLSHQGSAWGAHYRIGHESDRGAARAERRATTEFGEGPAGMSCWEASSNTLVITLPTSAPEEAHLDRRADETGAQQPSSGQLALSHAMGWLSAQTESAASWGWNGPSPLAISWGPAEEGGALRAESEGGAAGGDTW